ncbi:hypothetical protein HYW39_00545 [Candidatus Curtissbacteria bacterium]|nr:hypothetical protein [Candidatus Curtissbacteria bacterium]
MKKKKVKIRIKEKTTAGAGSAWNIKLVARKAPDKQMGFLTIAKKEK